MTADHPESLYVHIPFCRSICGYCDFCRVVYRREDAERYLNALERELHERNISKDLKTVYIGGGTPTCLDEDVLERLLSLLYPYVQHVLEYTVEVNPETLDERKAALLHRYGINRASVGMQSSDPGLLSLMNRHHSFETVKRCVQILRDSGTGNISLDLMYSLPGQTMEMLEKSVADALSLHPGHLSLYALTIEENSVFGRKGYEHLDEDTEADMYEYLSGRLREAGYEHYEISNFALPGKRSMHNCVYWQYRDFYGIGCGASGKENDLRYDVCRSLKQYTADPLQRDEIPLSLSDRYFEAVMMSLRLREGLDEALFREMFGIPVQEVYGSVIDRLCVTGLLQDDGIRLSCTEKGWPLLNEILIEFLA